MLRMARQRGVDVQKLIGDEYKQVKVDDRDERRNKILETLDDHFRPGAEDDSEANWIDWRKNMHWAGHWLCMPVQINNKTTILEIDDWIRW